MKFNSIRKYTFFAVLILTIFVIPVAVFALILGSPGTDVPASDPGSVTVSPADNPPQGAVKVTPATQAPQGVVDLSAKDSSTFGIKNPLDPKFNTVGSLVQGFVEIFSYLAILFAVLLLIWVGFRFILARGDSTKMNELKSWLMWIVVGVAVVIGARVIIQVIINTLSATGTVSQGVIQNVQKAVKGQ